jgi:DUF1680 family protein
MGSFNLYVASRLDWRERGFVLQQETQFPETDRMVLTVRATDSKSWTLKLCIPALDLSLEQSAAQSGP